MTTKYDGEELNQIVSTLKRIDKFVVCAGTVKTMDMYYGHFLEAMRNRYDHFPFYPTENHGLPRNRK